MKTVFKLTRMSAPLVLWDYSLPALKLCLPSWRCCPLSETKEANTQNSQRCKRQRETICEKTPPPSYSEYAEITPVEKSLWQSVSIPFLPAASRITADALNASLTIITTHSHAPVLYSVTWHQTDIYLGYYKHTHCLIDKTKLSKIQLIICVPGPQNQS